MTLKSPYFYFWNFGSYLGLYLGIQIIFVVSYFLNLVLLLTLCSVIQVIIVVTIIMLYTPSVLEAFNSEHNKIKYYILLYTHFVFLFITPFFRKYGVLIVALLLLYEGILLYSANEWIEQALSVAAETMKNWPNPQGGGSSSLVGSTGEEFSDLKRNHICAKDNVIMQERHMLDLIREQARLENEFNEGLFIHQNSMKDLYQMHLDTRDARNAIKNDISNACADLSTKRAVFRETVQSLEIYLKR